MTTFWTIVIIWIPAWALYDLFFKKGYIVIRQSLLEKTGRVVPIVPLAIYSACIASIAYPIAYLWLLPFFIRDRIFIVPKHTGNILLSLHKDLGIPRRKALQLIMEMGFTSSVLRHQNMQEFGLLLYEAMEHEDNDKWADVAKQIYEYYLGGHLTNEEPEPKIHKSQIVNQQS